MLKLFQVLFFLIYLFLCAGRFTAYIDNNIITWCPWLLWWYCLCRWQSPQKVWCETADVCPERSAHFQGEYTCCSVMIHIHFHTSSSCCNTESLLKSCCVPAAVAECMSYPSHTCKYFFLCPLPIQRAFGTLLSHPAACCVARSDPPELLHHTLTHYYDILLSCHCVFSKDSHAFLYNYDGYFIDIVLHWWIAFKSLLCDVRWANDIRCRMLVQSSFQPIVVV